MRKAETGAYTAYLAYSNIYDITSNNTGIGQLDGSAALTASWTEPTYTLSINPNGGSWGGSTSTTTKTLKYSDVLNASTASRRRTRRSWRRSRR